MKTLIGIIDAIIIIGIVFSLTTIKVEGKVLDQFSETNYEEFLDKFPNEEI